MIHVNLHIQLPEQWGIINSFRSDGQMEFDTDKCHSIQRLKGQLTVTDKFTVHEDQIIEIQCSRLPRVARLCCHNKRLISVQLESHWCRAIWEIHILPNTIKALDFLYIFLKTKAKRQEIHTWWHLITRRTFFHLFLSLWHISKNEFSGLAWNWSVSNHYTATKINTIELLRYLYAGWNKCS